MVSTICNLRFLRDLVRDHGTEASLITVLELLARACSLAESSIKKHSLHLEKGDGQANGTQPADVPGRTAVDLLMQYRRFVLEFVSRRYGRPQAVLDLALSLGHVLPLVFKQGTNMQDQAYNKVRGRRIYMHMYVYIYIYIYIIPGICEGHIRDTQ
jgi:hypothetical protein